MLRCAVEDEAACHVIAAGDDDLCVVDEVGDRSDVGGNQVLVLTTRHRLAVIRQFVLHIVHEIIEASLVQSVKVCAVAGLKIGGRNVSTSCRVCRLRAKASSGLLVPQLTAFFTSAAILASSAAVNSFSANEVGHIAPSSRFASSLKPNVAYLDLNFSAGWKKQTTLPSLA